MNPFRYRPLVLSAVLATGAVAASIAVGQASNPAGTQARPARIAVANVPRILSELREAKDLDATFASEKDKLAMEEAKMKEDIRSLEGQAGNFRPDSPQYEDLQNRYVEAVSKYKIWGETVKFRRETQKKRLTRMLYDKIYAAIGEYAAREGIEMVISDVQPMLTEKEFAQVPLEQLGPLLNQRRVLYSGKSSDISQAIIALLDSKYGGVGAAPGGQNPATPQLGSTQGPIGTPVTASGAGAADARPAGGEVRQQPPPAARSNQPTGGTAPNRRPGSK